MRASGLMSCADLSSFEDSIAEAFNRGEIPHPVHLSSGNEGELIKIFKEVKYEDWCFCSWRSHYHCLLKGVPKEQVMDAIMNGRSMAMCFPGYRVYSSPIVGAVAPMGVGVGLAIKRRGLSEKVWVFLGDMTAETGIAHESMKYARNHDLPVRWVIEDNGVSVMTDTAKAWCGLTDWKNQDDVIYYRYRSKFPHAGAGKRINF